ncbi:hypothetical protein KAS42_01310 [bacterium]|nr:hypothetical protein [bacterium]
MDKGVHLRSVPKCFALGQQFQSMGLLWKMKDNNVSIAQLLARAEVVFLVYHTVQKIHARMVPLSHVGIGQ